MKEIKFVFIFIHTYRIRIRHGIFGKGIKLNQDKAIKHTGAALYKVFF